MLLTLFVTDPNLIEKLKPDIREEDFTEGVYRLIIHELYQQMESAGKVNPAAIFDRFDDVEDQKMISRIINRAPKYESEEMKSKMITDVVRKIKLSSIEAEMKQATDSQRLMQLMNDLKKYKNYTFI